MLRVRLPCAGRGTGSLQPNAASKGTVRKDHRGQPFIIESIPPQPHHTRQFPPGALSAKPPASLKWHHGAGGERPGRAAGAKCRLDGPLEWGVSAGKVGRPHAASDPRFAFGSTGIFRFASPLHVRELASNRRRAMSLARRSSARSSSVKSRRSKDPRVTLQRGEVLPDRGSRRSLRRLPCARD